MFSVILETLSKGVKGAVLGKSVEFQKKKKSTK